MLIRFLLCLSIILQAAIPLSARGLSDSDELFSPMVAEQFNQIARELARDPNAEPNQYRQALTFLTAAMQLESPSAPALDQMIRLLCKMDDPRYLPLVPNLLSEYVNQTTNLAVAKDAVYYLLRHSNTRERREQILQQLIDDLQGQNDWLESWLQMRLATLAVEKADFQTAATLFAKAHNKNKHNSTAFLNLADLVPDQISTIAYLEHLRLRISENPVDLNAAGQFASYTEQLQLFDIADDAYAYYADCFEFINPQRPLPPSIYLPWALANYNSDRNQHKCLDIVRRVRQSNRFNLLLEAVAAKAAQKLGNNQQASDILQNAKQKAIELISKSDDPNSPLAEQLGWFYCFADPNAEEALKITNRAYSKDPNSITKSALLAYALAMNQQENLARTLINQDPNNQITALAAAKISIHNNNKTDAINHLRKAIDLAPASVEAQQAKQILNSLDADHIPPLDPALARSALKSSASSIVPEFVLPDEIFNVQLNLQGSNFSFDDEFQANIFIENTSDQPLVISEQAMFSGNIRIDANVTGDLNRTIKNLVVRKFQPPHAIMPGGDAMTEVTLRTGRLKDLLFKHPQACVEITFTVYLDPVVTEEKGVQNAIPSFPPYTLTIKRTGVNLTANYLTNRFNSLKTGRAGPKIDAALLFTALLAEQNQLEQGEISYQLKSADWMGEMLRSGIIHTLDSADWTVRTHAAAYLVHLPLDYEFAEALSNCLNEGNWPLRLISLYTLAKSDSDFQQVLNHSAMYDQNELVRSMAVALGGKTDTPPELTELLPSSIRPSLSASP